jgi:hypothetical protein
MAVSVLHHHHGPATDVSRLISLLTWFSFTFLMAYSKANLKKKKRKMAMKQLLVLDHFE